MEIIGFISLIVITGFIGLYVAIGLFMRAGTYNIGGVPNDIYERIIYGLIIPTTYIYWLYYLFTELSPFIISLKV